MTRKIIKIGSSAGVTIPKESLERRGLSVGDELEFRDDGDTLSFSAKKDNDQRDKLAKRTLDFINRYRADLEALADK